MRENSSNVSLENWKLSLEKLLNLRKYWARGNLLDTLYELKFDYKSTTLTLIKIANAGNYFKCLNNWLFGH